MYTIDRRKVEEVTDKVFLEWWGFEKWQLDKLKKHAEKRGFFKINGWEYYLSKECIDLSIEKKDESIIIPIYTDIVGKRKIKFNFTDKKYFESKPAKKSFKNVVEYDGVNYGISDFIKRSNISDPYFRSNTKDVSECKINGISLKIHRTSRGSLYSFIDTNGKAHSNKTRKEVMTSVGCATSKFDQISEERPSVKYKGYVISREKI